MSSLSLWHFEVVIDTAGGGPMRQVATFADPKVAAIVAWRRTRMHGVDADRDASYAGVNYLSDDGDIIPLLGFYRVRDDEKKTIGVRVESHPLRGRPALNPADFFALRIEDGRLMVEGPKS